jgi:hypothetical protein
MQIHMKRNCLLVLFITLFSFTGYTQILDTLIKKHRLAVGGEAAYKKLFPYKATYVYESGGDRTDIEVYRGNGNLLRVNKKFFFRNEPVQPDKLFFELINEQGAWAFAPDQTDSLPRKLSAYEINRLLESYDWDDPLLDYTQRKIRLDYLSTEFFNETFYHKILVHYIDGKQEYLFLHPETFFIERRILNDPTIVDDKTIAEYRVLTNNARWPARIEMGESQLKLISFSPQTTLPATLFKSPAKTAK